MTIQEIPDSLGLVLAKSSGHLFLARLILYSRAPLGRFKGAPGEVSDLTHWISLAIMVDRASLFRTILAH